MENLTPKQQRIVKMVVGAATLAAIAWFIFTSRVVSTALYPAAEAGRLGGPATSSALVLATELLVSFGGWALVMYTSIWRTIAGYVAPLFVDEENDPATNDDAFIKHALRNELSPERRAELTTALLIAVEKQDFGTVIRVSERIAGNQFFPRKPKPADDPQPAPESKPEAVIDAD